MCPVESISWKQRGLNGKMRVPKKTLEREKGVGAYT